MSLKLVTIIPRKWEVSYKAALLHLYGAEKHAKRSEFYS